MRNLSCPKKPVLIQLFISLTFLLSFFCIKDLMILALKSHKKIGKNIKIPKNFLTTQYFTVYFQIIYSQTTHKSSIKLNNRSPSLPTQAH